MKSQWKEVPGFNGYYLADEIGNLRNARGKTIRQTKDSYGYLYVGRNPKHGRKAAKVHRMVAMAFIPNPENKPTVNHINGIKHDNRVCNLEWMTMKENIRHAAAMGKMSNNRGEKSGTAKLTLKKVQKIRRLISKGIMYKTIAAEFGVSPSTIGHIAAGIRWDYSGKRKYPAKD